MTLHYNLFVAGGLDQRSLLSRALLEKHLRAMNRTLTLLGLIHGPDDVAAVRHALAVNDARLRSRAIEYLDNLLDGDTRKRVMLLIEDMPAEERIRKGNVIYRTRTRDVEDTLAQLLHDDDQSTAAAAILLVEEKGSVDARRRSRVRPGASRRARLRRVRGGVVGAGGQSCGRGAAPPAVAGAAAGGRARGSVATRAAVRVRRGARAVLAGAPRQAGPPRTGPRRSTGEAPR